MFVEIETKSEKLLLINCSQVSFIRVIAKEFRAIVFFNGSEPLELTLQDGHQNQMRSLVEFDNALEKITTMQGRF
jgi:hypothetical protein